MKFDQVYQRLYDYQTELNLRMLLLAEDTLREIYACVIATEARECLELGSGFGATACVIAAALEEIGGGTVTTVDRIGRQPVGLPQLADLTGMTRYIRSVVHSAGYNWFLMQALLERTRNNVCEPCYDFCYLDGAHEWQSDAPAALLMTRLLRPGGWMMVDDLNFKIRDCHPGWEAEFADRSADEVDTRQVGMVFDLLVKTDPALDLCMLTNTGHIGWARKRSPKPPAWQPDGVVAGTVAGSWSESYTGAEIPRDEQPAGDTAFETQGDALLIRATADDPFMVIRNPIEPARPIDFITLRLRLVEPDMETLQLFWIGGDDVYFNEPRSVRCTVRTFPDLQDLTFCFRGSIHERTIRLFRLDPSDGPSTMLIERLTIGGR